MLYEVITEPSAEFFAQLGEDQVVCCAHQEMEERSIAVAGDQIVRVPAADGDGPEEDFTSQPGAAGHPFHDAGEHLLEQAGDADHGLPGRNAPKLEVGLDDLGLRITSYNVCYTKLLRRSSGSVRS